MTGVALGLVAGLPEPLGEEGRKGLAGGIRIEIGQGVDVEAVPAVGIRDDDGAVDLGGAGADGQALPQEVGAEAEALGGVVIARSEDHPGDVRQAAQGVVQEPDGIGGRDGAVVDVARHDDGIDGLAAGELDEVIGEGLLGVIEDAPVEGAPQVPVGGVQDPHGRSLSRGCDMNRGAIGRSRAPVGPPPMRGIRSCRCPSSRCEPDRSRRGTEPISVRNRTDLDELGGEGRRACAGAAPFVGFCRVRSALR